MPVHLIAGLIFVILTYKYACWKEWKLYYSTILFFIIGDLIYNFLFYDYLLWEYVSPIFTHKGVSFIWDFIYFPCTILFFFSKYPEKKSLWKQVLYILFWSSLYAVLETIFSFMGYFKYNRGWNIWWSFCFNLLIFPILTIHHKKAFWGWFMAIAFLIFVIIYFHIPIDVIK